MGDLIQLLTAWNLSPLNTILLAVVAFFLRWSVRQTFDRLKTLEDQNRQQDLALERLETQLGIGPRFFMKE